MRSSARPLLLAALLGCSPDYTDKDDSGEAEDGADGSDGTDGTDGTDGADGTDGSDGGNETSVVLFINEFMASNQSTTTDENGGYADWIELYNPGTEDVVLDGFTMTDDLTEPDLHVLSGGLVVPAGGFLLLWADGFADLSNHLDFKLAAAGESIGLYDPEGNALSTLDYGAQATDVSAARVPDGSESWTFLTEPTPGFTNGSGR